MTTVSKLSNKNLERNFVFCAIFFKIKISGASRGFNFEVIVNTFEKRYPLAGKPALSPLSGGARS